MKITSLMKSQTARSGIALLALLAAGNMRAGQQELAAAIGETRGEVMQTRDQLQATVDTIDALTKQKSGDMRPAYDKFVAARAKTQTAADITRNRADKMSSEAGTHFSTWQKEIDGIANASVKKKAQRRLESVQRSYNKVLAQLKEAAGRFRPLLSDLTDIEKALSNDLTPGGVKSVRSSVNDARWNLKSARSATYDALNELASMEKSLGTTASK